MLFVKEKRMKYFLLVLLLVSSMAHAHINVYFSPSLQCENNLVKWIDSAQKSIDASVYAINNDEIVEALKKAHARGVKIRILTDRLQAASKYSKVIDLYQYGINIRVHSKFKIEHNKFAVFDSRSAFGGSYNWTKPATHKNSENCIFITQQSDVVEKYQTRFNYLWQINTRKKSKKWFERKI